ncbi:helix-turn-helix domain-containing protein [Brevundimonas nasdae]|uniref:helix-turn-helix domain-containing protein n=1 Tax=Brevundimonas nasdae TaxID=172043 RepID=UPI0039774DB5
MSKPHQQHERIKSALALRGISLSDIARQLQVAPSTVTIVSKGDRRSRRIEAALAAALGCDAWMLWPERYPERKGATSMPAT